MKTSVISKLTGLGIGSFAALCIGWSGLSYAIEVEDNFTTVSKASTKIQYYEQTASGVTEKVTLKRDDLILKLTNDTSDKPPKNYQLVLLNWCGDIDKFSALAVWDKDRDELVEGADAACLWSEGSWVFDEKKGTLYRPMDIGAWAFEMDEIDMDAEIKGGKLKKNIDSSQPFCLKKFKTMAMSGYYNNGNGENGSRVMRKAGSIKTSGAVFDTIPGNAVFNLCVD